MKQSLKHTKSRVLASSSRRSSEKSRHAAIEILVKRLNLRAEPLEINEALDRLNAIDPRLARVVECRFFGGLSEEEIAAALGVTVRTVQRDWVKARMLLRRELAR